MGKRIPDTPAKQLEARRLQAEGLTQRAIAKRLGVSALTVWKWIGNHRPGHAKQVKGLSVAADHLDRLAERARQRLPLFEAG